MTTSIRHLNCATMHPRSSLGGRFTPQRIVAHCLLVELPDRLVLVDTGFGTIDLATKRMGRDFVAMMGLSLDPAETAAAQVRAAGHDPLDVTDILVTHLDLDHAGGIGDFPQARVHVRTAELDAARDRTTLREKKRYIPTQWEDAAWVEYPTAGERWFGFDAVSTVTDDLLLIPLRGHTRGHCGVAVRRPSGGWFLHAGDAYFNTGEKQTPPTCPSGLALFQSFVQVDARARHQNQQRLRELHRDHGDEITIFSAHDAEEFDELAELSD